MAVPRLAGSKFSTVSPSASKTCVTTRGAITSPPLAIAAATIAICSGVTRTSRSPMPLCPNAAGSSSSSPVGKTDAAVVHGREIESPNPRRSATIPIWAAPSWIARSAKTVLQERTKATCSVTWVPLAHTPSSKFWIVASEPGSTNSTGSSNVVSGE